MDEHGWNRLARTAWQLMEPYHGVVYFGGEQRAACDRAGLRGGWMAYFATRSAPLGPVPAEVVTALFYGFHPAMVARAIPDAWGFADPAAVLAARTEGAGAALRRLLGDGAASQAVSQAAGLARTVALEGEIAGHPLFAANLALDWPDEPHLVLWHAATLLREHRGEGHVATLVGAEVAPCQAHVLQVAAGRGARETLQRFRGWSDAEWSEAVEALQQRGWLDSAAALTDAGRAGLADIDRRTDRLASAPLRRAGLAATQGLLEALGPVVRPILAAGEMPFPNPVGVPRAELPPAP